MIIGRLDARAPHALVSELVNTSANAIRQGDPDNDPVMAALRMASGYINIDEVGGFQEWSKFFFQPYGKDVQYYLHVDTWHPTIKVWLMPETSAASGPLHFVPGSHRNDERKLRWLYNRTRHRLHMPTGRTIPPSQSMGPYYDITHGDNGLGGGSMRVQGFDPKDADAIRDSLATFHFQPPTPLETGPGWSLVIADTSGFHHRGLPTPPHTMRVFSFLHPCAGASHSCNKLCDGVGRKNTFVCASRPDLC